MRTQFASSRDGFALILTITLLSLLVLALCGLSALVKVNGQISTQTAAQTRARQNALLGLSMGIADLQHYAGDDSRITGMAGITGVAAHAASTTRNWCGVWRDDGSFVAWLTSGALTTDTPALRTGIAAIKLAGDGSNGGAGSVGASSANSEHVIAGKIPITVSEIAATPGSPATIGSYAFLISDEGIKISAYSPAFPRLVPNLKPVLASTVATTAQAKLRAALDSFGTKLPAIVSYEQLSLLPTPSAPLTQSVLQDNFHHVTLTALTLAEGELRAGGINLNTTSPYVWRSILETYNSAPGTTDIPAASLLTYVTTLVNGYASSTSGKNADGPFTSVAGFAGSALLADNLPTPITPAEFMAAIGGMLTTRSDTFRVRVYGESLDGLNGTIEANAYAEAILQRTAELAPNGLGRKFVVTGFRWLGPDDI